MISIAGLSRSFGEHVALSNLNLEIEPGQVFCLLGPNGAGKTTTLNLLLGFLPPTSGDVRVAGIPVGKDPLGVRRRLGYVPESVGLHARFSGLENVEYFAELGGARGLSRARLREVLARVGLAGDVIERPLGNYSKGMRQKVALAIALVREVDVLLLDEPTSGLDPRSSLELATTLAELAGRRIAALITTHDLFFAIRCATHFGILIRGQMVDRFPASGLKLEALEARYMAAVQREVHA